jgi:hypothetical protein
MPNLKPVRFNRKVIDPSPAGRKNNVLLLFDVNGDGHNDIVMGGYTGAGNIVWYEYPTWKRRVIGSAPLEAGGAVHDINRDGRLDFVAGEMTSNHLYWWENTGDYDRPWPMRIIEDKISANYHDQAFGDVDGDGEPELVIISKRDDIGIYYDIPDDPTVEPWPASCRHVFYQGLKSEGLAIADIDGDGENEILVGAGYFKKSRRRGGVWRRIEIVKGWYPPRVAVADLNGDGKLDVVLSEAEVLPARLAWFEAPDWKMHLLRDDLSNLHSLCVADMNGDGHPDIFAAEMHLERKEMPVVTIFLGDGKGGFEESEVLDNPVGTHESKVAVFGKKGLPSIVIKPYYPHNCVELWENVTG